MLPRLFIQWTCAPGSVGGDGGVDLAAFVAERGVPDGGVFSCADTDSLGGASPSSSVVVLEDVPQRRAKRRRLTTPEPLAMAVDVRTPHMEQQTLTAAKQSTRMVATLEAGSPRTPRKQRHRKGEEGHQEWCREGFHVKEVLGPDKRPRSITAVCRICLKDHNITKRYKVLSYNPRKKYPTSASWSGPSNHLKDKHDIFSIEALRDKLSQPPGNQQMKLGTSLETYLETWHPRTSEWDRAVTHIARYVSFANAPYHLAETAPFVRLMRAFIPRWPSISKQTIVRSVARQANEIKREIREEVSQLRDESRVAMTTDIWTSRSTDSYITVTLHWVDANWSLKKRILGEFGWHILCPAIFSIFVVVNCLLFASVP